MNLYYGASTIKQLFPSQTHSLADVSIWPMVMASFYNWRNQLPMGSISDIFLLDALSPRAHYMALTKSGPVAISPKWRSISINPDSAMRVMHEIEFGGNSPVVVEGIRQSLIANTKILGYSGLGFTTASQIPQDIKNNFRPFALYKTPHREE